MQNIDENILLFVQGIRWEPLTKLFTFFIPLEIWNITAIILVFFFFFRTKTLRVPIVSFVLAKCSSAYCYEILKHHFHRPRPFLTIKGLVPVITPHGYSSPSGHATLAMAMAVILAYHFPKARGWVFTLTILIGFSRIYFGAHYLSDVLGGFLLGGILGWLCIFFEQAILSVNKGIKLTGTTQRNPD